VGTTGRKSSRRRSRKKSTEFCNENINPHITKFTTTSFRSNGTTAGISKKRSNFDRISHFNYPDFID
jgi:hypothetical protein